MEDFRQTQKLVLVRTELKSNVFDSAQNGAAMHGRTQQLSALLDAFNHRGPEAPGPHLLSACLGFMRSREGLLYRAERRWRRTLLNKAEVRRGNCSDPHARTHARMGKKSEFTFQVHRQLHVHKFIHHQMCTAQERTRLEDLLGENSPAPGTAKVPLSVVKSGGDVFRQGHVPQAKVRAQQGFKCTYRRKQPSCTQLAALLMHAPLLCVSMQ
jgi:hypothetical protein